MHFQIKSKKQAGKTAKHLRLNYFELDNQAQIDYGTSYDKLNRKEQIEIANKVTKNKSYFHI